ncbi:MAG: superoxide dismutase [Patescibacteria group bacterium]|nr:superoxide dismutase [Patescibacteria group bacterium]
MEYFILPDLKYDYNALKPYISEEQLRIHHDKHHKAYVDAANKILEKLESARKENLEIDQKAELKALSFNIGGVILHSLFWENMGPEKEVRKEPEGNLKEAIDKEFGSFERFKKEFSDAASTIEGPGWTTLSYDWLTKRLFINQIEKHNDVLYPTDYILLVLDMWEHAYYLDYKSEKKKFIDAFWNILNWEEVEKRFEGKQ